jgi:hypothetical protein
MFYQVLEEAQVFMEGKELKLSRLKRRLYVNRNLLFLKDPCVHDNSFFKHKKSRLFFASLIFSRMVKPFKGTFSNYLPNPILFDLPVKLHRQNITAYLKVSKLSDIFPYVFFIL